MVQRELTVRYFHSDLADSAGLTSGTLATQALWRAISTPYISLRVNLLRLWQRCVLCLHAQRSRIKFTHERSQTYCPAIAYLSLVGGGGVVHKAHKECAAAKRGQAQKGVCRPEQHVAHAHVIS